MSAWRLFAIAAAYAAGVMVAEAWSGAGVAAGAGGAAVVLLGAACIARPSPRRAGMLVLAAAATLGWCLAGLRLASVDGAALAAGAHEGADAVLHGQVLARPQVAGGALRFPMGVSRATLDGRGWIVRERAAVSIRPPPHTPPRPGDLLVVDARLARVLPGARGPDEAVRRARASARRLRHAGIAARAYARPDGVRVTGRSRNPIVAVAAAGQKAAERAVAGLPPREGGLLLGITVGDDSRLDPDMEADFRATGLTHLLAVSGSNLAFFLGAIALGLRPLRLGRRAGLAAMAAATLAFMAITRFEPSVVRAGAMAAVGFVAVAAGARRAGLHALAVAVLGLLVWDPMLVHSPGFQLSALATFGILVIGPRLIEALGRGKVAAAAAVTLGAQLAVGPLIALQFHQVSLVALPANLAAVPAVAPATVLGFLAAAVGSLWAPLGEAVAFAARPFLAWMGWVASVFARVPAASVGTPAGPAALLVVAASAAAAVAAYRARRIRPFVGVSFSVLALVASATWSGAVGPGAVPDGLRVTALDVGQGDATLVQAPGGATMLVDGGPDERALLAHLRKRRVRRIDLLVLTHPHADHVDGLAAVVSRYPVGRALDPDQPSELPSHARYLAALSQRRIPRDVGRAGLRYSLGPATVEVIGPQEILAGTDSDLNNNSIVLRLTYGAATVLLSGEVQEDGQDLLLQRPEALRAILFKVPHHGSPRALREFYAATGARLALVSVGAGNDYGHPALSILAWCADLGMRVLRTDRSGDVVVSLGRTGAWAITEQRASPERSAALPQPAARPHALPRRPAQARPAAA